jgi:hypothetical protein
MDGTKAEGLIIIDAAPRVIRFRYSASLEPDGGYDDAGFSFPLGHPRIRSG